MYFTGRSQTETVATHEYSRSLLVEGLVSYLKPALAALPIVIPLVLAAAAAWVGVARPSVAAAWKVARMAGTLSLGSAALSLALLAATQPFVVPLGAGLSLLGIDVLSLSLRFDAAGGAVMLLVAFIGWVIARYSQPYLAGEPRERFYVVWLLATLAAVAVVILTNNLLVLALAWTATSVSLHHLLTFYADRPAALIAAHKKFLCSRVAEICLFASVMLIGASIGTLEIDQLLARAAALATFPGVLQVAVVLLAIAAMLKCAQLPFHGWLIQVMEAPTPVSALLHAGVVNLGGFVLIRLSTLVSAVPLAQTLLVCVGTVTAVLASLVMTTRISIKVQLAWSTCAQMGFMLMQCGLGAYELALLHLVAHSLYKAHAFLGAGGAVRRSSIRQLSAEMKPTPIGLALAGAVAGAAMVALAGWLWGIRPDEQPSLWALAAIVALALTPLVSTRAWRLGGTWLPLQMASSFLIALAYFGLHAVFSHWVPAPQQQPATWLWTFVLASFALLFVAQSVIAAQPGGRLARALYPWFYAGLFLDDRFSRAAFALWPLRRRTPGSVDQPGGRPATTTRGALS